MKKVLCVFLALTLAALTLLPAFAAHADECDVSPVISVRGFGADLFVQAEDGSEKGAFSFTPSEISTMAAQTSLALVKLAMQNDYKGFVDKMREAVDILAGNLLCDDEGNTVKPIVTHSDPTDTDTHLNTDYAYFKKDEPHGNYVFDYDWRLSPMDVADQLAEYIEEVKAVTGHDRVTLLSHSEGNNVTSAYFYKYGTANVRNSVHLSPAWQGISIVGEAFTKQVDLENKGSGLQDFLRTVLGEDNVFQFLNATVTSLQNLGMLDFVLNGLDKVLDKTLEQVYDEILIDTFATMPAMWSFVPDEYYDEAKQVMFGDDEKYATLIGRIDDYHDNVQNNITGILSAAMDSGTPVAIVCGYGIAVIPVTTVTDSQGDMLIDTKYASLGATAAPFGGKLESGERLSPDGQIDASTCAFPEYTWFVKYQSHNNWCEPYKAFILWLAQYDGQPTVTTNEAYPQFMICVNHEYLRAVEPTDERVNTGLLQRLLKRLTEMFRKLFGRFSASLPKFDF